MLKSRGQGWAMAKPALPDVERGPAAGSKPPLEVGWGGFKQSWPQKHAQAEGTAADACLRVKPCQGARRGCLPALTPNVRPGPLIG